MSGIGTPRANMLDLGSGSDASYRVVGHGLPVLAIPGGPRASAEHLRLFAEPVADRTAWYLVDPPGIGGTSPVKFDEDNSIEGHVAFYRTAADALDLARLIVFGHSYGAVVAMTFAARHPDITIGCVLAAPPVVGRAVDMAETGEIVAAMDAAIRRHADAPWFAAAMAALEADPGDPETGPATLRAMAPLYLAHPTEPQLQRAWDLVFSGGLNPAPARWFYGHEWPTLDLRDLLGSVGCPVLAVVGEHDWAAPPGQARLVGEFAPRSTVVEIADVGHFVPLEAPEAFGRAVRDWLDREFRDPDNQ